VIAFVQVMCADAGRPGNVMILCSCIIILINIIIVIIIAVIGLRRG